MVDLCAVHLEPRNASAALVSPLLATLGVALVGPLDESVREAVGHEKFCWTVELVEPLEGGLTQTYPMW